jgi:hypothetical protein
MSRRFMPVCGAFFGPVLWVLEKYVLRRSDAWTAYWSLDGQVQGLILAGAVAVITATVVAWRGMLPLWGLAAAVALYLHLSRPKDSL